MMEREGSFGDFFGGEAICVGERCTYGGLNVKRFDVWLACGNSDLSKFSC